VMNPTISVMIQPRTMMDAPPIKPLDASITFLGTASMRPSPTRNVSGNAVRIGREWTIVDCGEGTQHQVLRCASSDVPCTRISPGNINRIFVTHLHGDHCFGLPGLMCQIGNAHAALESNYPKQKKQKRGARQFELQAGKEAEAQANGDGDGDGRGIVHIVGPKGLRSMIRVALLTSCTGVSFKFRIDELWTARDVQQQQHEGDTTHSNQMSHFASVFGVDRHSSEIDGINVSPENDGTWVIPSHPSGGPVASSWRFHAAPLVHTIDSVGYVFVEAPHRGNLDASLLRGRLLTDENREYQQSVGIRNPLQLLGLMQKGQTVTIKEGGAIVELSPADFMSRPTPGRKVVILGDTCDSRQLAGLAAGADVIVHEATNAAIEDGETEHEVLQLAVSRGHSTPSMAGDFARCCGALKLVLTHFSSRYKGDESEESLSVMKRIVDQAKKTLGHDNVVAARDMMEIKLLVHKGRKAVDDSCGVSPMEASGAAAAAADSYLQKAGHFFK